ncbi:hypothetical protein ACS0TY_010391 [Phlomoides rotata]
MGREWLYWVAGGGMGTRRRRSRIKEQGTTSSGGCMCAVFQLFDLNQFQLPLNLHPHIQEEKGVEAPRNSLELEEREAVKSSSKPLAMNKEEEFLNFPVGSINQIKTRASNSRTDDLCGGTNSPFGTKTPNLVARLMGLDLLPECSSPKSQKRCFSDDDISIGASRRSDVDHHHRLSLQINTERISQGRIRKQDENSPGKQIVRESVSTRVGLLDITNTNSRRDQNLLIKVLHKKSQKLDGQISPDFKQSLDSRKCRSTGIKSPRNSSSKQQNDCRKIEMPKSCGAKKLSTQSLDKGMRNKKSALSTELELVPTLLPVKKDPSSSPPATKLPQNQVSSDSLLSKRNTQLSCHTSRSYTQLHNLPGKISTVPENVLPDNANGFAAAPEYKSYVNKILKRAGIVDKFTPLTLGKWHTPSHPLDPSIFYYLELFHPAGLSRRCNRKLIFQLVDELLADLLRPRLDFKQWGFPIFRNNDHFGLDDELCKRIESFPAANCKVLEDIDSLVDNDLCKSPLSGCYQAEEERLVCEIEGEIVEWLVCETVSLVGVRTDEGRRLDRKVSRGSSRDEMPLVGVCGNHPRGYEVYRTV